MDNKLDEIKDWPYDLRVALFATLFYIVKKSGSSFPIIYETIKLTADLCDIDVEIGAQIVKDDKEAEIVEKVGIPPELQKRMTLVALTLFPMIVGGDTE